MAKVDPRLSESKDPADFADGTTLRWSPTDYTAAMTSLLLRAQSLRQSENSRQPAVNWQDDDFAVVVGDVRIGRIYRMEPPAGERWMWFLYAIGAPPPLSGSADTPDEALAAIKTAYERACGRQCTKSSGDLL